MVSLEFSNPAKCSVTNIFPACKNNDEIVYEANPSTVFESDILKTAKYIWYLLISSNFLLYFILIFLAPRYQIKEYYESEMCRNAFFPCLQGIRMCRCKREEQKTDVWSDKKKIQGSEKKNSVLFLNFFKQIWN